MTLKSHNPSDYFNAIDEQTMETMPFFAAKLGSLAILRDISGHPECFYPGCTELRPKSPHSRQKDGRLLTCIGHKASSDVNRASKAKDVWRRGE